MKIIDTLLNVLIFILLFIIGFNGYTVGNNKKILSGVEVEMIDYKSDRDFLKIYLEDMFGEEEVNKYIELVKSKK